MAAIVSCPCQEVLELFSDNSETTVTPSPLVNSMVVAKCYGVQKELWWAGEVNNSITLAVGTSTFLACPFSMLAEQPCDSIQRPINHGRDRPSSLREGFGVCLEASQAFCHTWAHLVLLTKALDPSAYADPHVALSDMARIIRGSKVWSRRVNRCELLVPR